MCAARDVRNNIDFAQRRLVKGSEVAFFKGFRLAGTIQKIARCDMILARSFSIRGWSI